MEKNKNGIEERYYYKLLEWKDENIIPFTKYAEFLEAVDYHGKKPKSMSDLNQKELIILYNFAFSDNLKP